MKSRIGIVSIYDNRNVGNKLQNYAVQKVLSEYIDNVLTLRNYYCSSNFLRNIRRMAADNPYIVRLLNYRRKYSFLHFNEKYINTSMREYKFNRKVATLRSDDSCEVYCVGSDQVWNPLFERSSMFNYLGFADYDATFSYAASFGVDKIPEQYVEDVRKGLQHIKFISVREDAGKQIVEELTGRTDVQVLVDPTMLLTTEEWDKIAAKPKARMPEKYVLTYFLGSVSPERRGAIREKAKQHNCEIIELMDKNSPFYVSGPSEFVYLIRNAALVCTDSFHGSVFSFLYQRPLAIFDREGTQENMGSRLETLASKFSLHGCLVKGNDLSALPMATDYSAGYAALNQERRKSKEFLDMVFREAECLGVCK